MLLKNLINKIPIEKKNIIIDGLATNSNDVRKNFIFFAIKGSKSNGENFIKEAISKGSTVVVCSKNFKFKYNNIFIIRTKNIRTLLSEVASKFYNLKPRNIIAVTGTNGKTSVADIFYQIMRLKKIPAASVGTLGIKYNNKVIKTNLTSPDTIFLHKYLNFLKEKKIDNVIIEASSHGLDQKRLHNIKFKGAIFTNFSLDHLDYHKTMQRYLNAKLILFEEILSQKSKIISDKEINPFNQLKKIAQKRNLKIIEIRREIKKIKNILSIQTSDFKLKNLAMAILATKLCGLKDKSVYQLIKKLKEVSGRLELVREFPNNIKVFVDYAHTPDALLETLRFLKKKYGDKISLVFGCGGDRDKKKRPFMAKIANNYCKTVYITDDNPRNENPKKIRKELSKYISQNKTFNIGNRLSAIKMAIKNARPQEIILIAGKGHEEKQVYKNKIIYISDKKVVKNLKIKKELFKKAKQNSLQNELILREILKKKRSLKFNGLSIDTRTIKKNDLFLAIKGNKTDGNQFIKKALKKGARVILTNLSKTHNKKIIKIKNPIIVLNQFARLKRKLSFSKIIAITGSAGKTSLKDLTKGLLQKFGSTHSSPKSFNNNLGVPISLSNLSCNNRFGVFEVGMSKTGEIRNLTKLIKPHVGIITNVGEAHIENFKNTQGIAEAKSEIIEKIETGGTIILNKDDRYFSFFYKKAKKYELKILTFGVHKKADVYLKKIIKNKNSSKIIVNIQNKILKFQIGDLNIYNVLASIALLNDLKLDLNKIKSNFKNIYPSDGRGKKHLISRYNKKFKLIDESYNANPLSVKTAIKKFDSIEKEKFKKYLLLGDMLELGSKSKKYHMELSKVINNSDIDKVFVKGKKTIFTYKHLIKEKRGNILQNDEDIDFTLGRVISHNDILMIKGSNATGLNNFSKKIIKKGL